MNGTILDWLKIVVPIIGTNILTYHFTRKGKLRDVELQKRVELNNVLSSLWAVRQYVTKIDDLLEIRNSEDLTFPIPKRLLPVVMLDSGLLNDACFLELDKAVDELKKHDPLTYADLQGLGKKLHLFKSNVVVPYLLSGAEVSVSSDLAESSIEDMVEEVENAIELITKKIDAKTYDASRQRLEKDAPADVKEMNERMMQETYRMFTKAGLKSTYEEYQTEMKDPEVRKQFEQAADLILGNGDFQERLKLVMNNPGISIEELQKSLPPAA